MGNNDYHLEEGPIRTNHFKLFSIFGAKGLKTDSRRSALPLMGAPIVATKDIPALSTNKVPFLRSISLKHSRPTIQNYQVKSVIFAEHQKKTATAKNPVKSGKFLPLFFTTPENPFTQDQPIGFQQKSVLYFHPRKAKSPLVIKKQEPIFRTSFLETAPMLV